MKRKTALQSAIDEFETLKSKSESIRDIVYLDGVIAVLTSKLPQEKQDLKKAFHEGISNGDNYGMDSAEEYFNQTFEA